MKTINVIIEATAHAFKKVVKKYNLPEDEAFKLFSDETVSFINDATDKIGKERAGAPQS